MPIQQCRKNGRPGYKYGDTGTCYPYTPNDDASRKRAFEKARRQGLAIEERRGGKFESRSDAQ